ncbi:MAG TPA: hypothetical protein VG435_07860 [Acidimicrobiales bacterium]|nr:hypothetical protein [Acidimicrobiales bacterium]
MYTEEAPVITAGPPATSVDGPGPDVEGWTDDSSEWMVEPVRTVRVRPVTLGLVAVLFVVAGLWGGATIEKHHGRSTTASSRSGAATAAGPSGSSTQFGGGPGGSGSGSTATGSGTATTGTVASIKNGTLTVTTSAGKKVTVLISPTTVVTRSGLGASGSRAVGDTVRIIGTTTSDVVHATDVTASGSGASAGNGPPGF